MLHFKYLAEYSSGLLVSIHTRGDQIDSKEEFGHFEVDTVESGRDGKGCVFTVVERKTRKGYALLAEACNADNFLNAIKKL